MKPKFGSAATEMLVGVLMAFSVPLIIQVIYWVTGKEAPGVALVGLMVAIILGGFLAFHGMYRDIRAGNHSMEPFQEDTKPEPGNAETKAA